MATLKQKFMNQQQETFHDLPFTPGVISTPQPQTPYYGFVPPPRQATISTYKPDLKTRMIDTLLDAVKGTYPGSEATGLMGQVVYHGSPHLFQKFQMNKIGTGEGAQAYGHGLYFADKPEVAKAYSTPPNRYADEITAINKRMKETATIMESNQVPGQYRQFKSPVGEQAAKYYDDLMEQRSALLKKSGHIYKVDLPDESIAKMLDWDKPLSQQPANVKTILEKMLLDRAIKPNEQWTGAQVLGQLETHYAQLFGKKGGNAQADASLALRRNGIPGIKYLDQVSRGKGAGTSNYVVFDEKIPQILERQ